MSSSKQRPFFVKVSAPAQRALQNQGIISAAELSKYSKAQVLRLHGMGPGSMLRLEEALAQNGLSFKAD